MEETPRGILSEQLKSWRRGPYPKSASFVSALSQGGDDEARWIADVHNILDLYDAFESLSFRQMEVLERYVVNGEEQRRIAGDIGLSQRAVGIELETALKILFAYFMHFCSEKPVI